MVTSGKVAVRRKSKSQCEVVEYLQEENRVLREQLGARRLRFTDSQRRRLAAKGRALGRRVLAQLGVLVTPDTILRWYRELITKKRRWVPARQALLIHDRDPLFTETFRTTLRAAGIKCLKLPARSPNLI